MSALRSAAEDYLRVRRALGYKLEVQGWLLDEFITYLEQIEATTITVDAAVAWATSPAAAERSYWAQRLSVVRQFARHLQTIDPACEIPAAALLPFRPRRGIPHLYQPEEITALIAAASTLPMALQAATYRTLIGLLAVTGLRLGEAIRLDRDDLDVDHQLLRILNSKFGKSREVALHESTIHALENYGRLREERFPKPRCEAFFLSTRGTRLLAPSIHETFNRLVAIAGLTPRPAGRRPRPHDLRHAFAVRTLLDWYRDGLDVQARLPLLSTWLGHVNPASTFWYLTAAPELLALAADRLDPTLEGLA
ncbi:MAG: tyrosine-type recombinase/integrase [Solirubrobacterales bacterium]|nr:tyrosine-type recombinase/integrase [Solirubrobacterales bacterium]